MSKPVLGLDSALIVFHCPVCEKNSASELSRWFTVYTSEVWWEDCRHCGTRWEMELKSKPSKLNSKEQRERRIR